MALTKAVLISKDTEHKNLVLSAEKKVEPIEGHGRIRLWVEGKPPKPTDIWIVIRDDQLTPIADAKSLTEAHDKDIDAKLMAILEARGLKMDDYGKGRSFHMDIQVPKEIADAYAD